MRPKETEAKKSFISYSKESINFLIKEDKRATLGMKNKVIIISLYVIGLLATIGLSAMGNLALATLLTLFPFIVAIVGNKLYAPIRKGKEEIYERIMSVKRDSMGLANRKGDATFDTEFEVTEWKDYFTPVKLKLFIPTNFDSLREEEFLQKFNQFLGAGSRWAPDRSNPEDQGWNYTKGHVNLMHMPPLPTKAMWNERYLLNDSIAWSFFPLALGVENGVKLHNDETDEDEFVLGFDVAGAQSKMKGVQVGDEVQQAPMSLVSGGTGGGKSLSVDTLVPTVPRVCENE